MNRKNKKLLKLVCAVGAVVALFLLLPGILNLEKYAAEAVGERINREIAMDKLKLRIWGGLRAEINNLSVSNGNVFSKMPFLKAERVNVEIKALPLIIGRVKVKKVVLEQPDFLLELSQDGVFNFSDMLQAKAGRGRKDEAALEADGAVDEELLTPLKRLLGAALISKLSIVDGRITFVDWRSLPGTRLVTFVNDLDLVVNSPSSNSVSHVDLKAALGRTQGHNITLKGKVIHGSKASEATYDFNLSVAGLDVGLLYPYYGHRVPFKLTGGFVNADIRIYGSTDRQVRTAGKIKINDMKVADARPSAISLRMDIDEDIAYNIVENKVAVRARIAIGKSELEVQGTVSNFKTEPEWDVRASSSNFDLGALGYLFPALMEKLPLELRLSGETAFSLNLFRTSDRLMARGSVDLERAEIGYSTYFQKAPEQPMKAALRLTVVNDVLRIDSLSAELGDLWLEVAGTVRTSPEPEVDLRFSTTLIEVEALEKLVPSLKVSRLPLRFRLEGTVQGLINKPEQLRFHLKTSL